MNPLAVTGAGAWIALVVGVLSFIGTVLVGVYAARSSRAANRETAHMTTQAKGWDDLTTQHSAEIARLREDRKEDEERWRHRWEEDRERHARERAEDRKALQECHTRIDRLTRRFEESEKRERALIAWAREVVRLMRAAKFDFPTPPPGVEDTDPGATRS